MRRIGTMMLGLALLFAGLSAMAEDKRSGVSLEGTGLFTQESNNRGISQRATEAGGLLVGYRYHFNDWIAAEANYGYSRNTQNFFNNGGLSRIQSNIHEEPLHSWSHLRLWRETQAVFPRGVRCSRL